MKKICMILLCLPLLMFGQGKKSRNEFAKNQIQQLHDGVMLVRLFKYQTKISALERAGKTEEAEKFGNAVSKMNTDLATAFKNNFSFCPVYFFYSENSEAIKNRNFDGLLLDASLNKTTTSISQGQSFFIAEINRTESDTAMYSEQLDYLHKDSSNIESRKTYYESNNISYLALLIRSDRFIQLQKPFPAFIKFKSYDQVPVTTEKINDAVKRLDSELKMYYQKNVKP